mmetsp:Transcript_54374/g.58972  ORF Transcript_54374/g.58972 Transcript_54374/m.58972 type:complete len:326 (+) Transcript_54374:124-1101(+)
MVLGMVRTRVLERVLERVPGRRLLMDVIQIPNANITPAKVSVLETVVLDHHRHPVMLLLSAMDTTAARVMLLLFALDPPAAPVIQIPNVNFCVSALTAQDVVLDHHRLFQFHHRNHVNFVLMALVRIAALVIQILVVPLNVLPVETVVFHHHQEKNAMKSVISLAVAVAVERVVKEERVEREDTMVALVDTDVTYSFMVMTMADLVDLVDLMIINSMADTMEADSEADSVLVTRNSVVVTAERVDTEEKVEKEEKEERVDTMAVASVDTVAKVERDRRAAVVVSSFKNVLPSVHYHHPNPVVILHRTALPTIVVILHSSTSLHHL